MRKRYYWTVYIDKRFKDDLPFEAIIVDATDKKEAYENANIIAGDMYENPVLNKTGIHKSTFAELRQHIFKEYYDNKTYLIDY